MEVHILQTAIVTTVIRLKQRFAWYKLLKVHQPYGHYYMAAGVLMYVSTKIKALQQSLSTNGTVYTTDK